MRAPDPQSNRSKKRAIHRRIHQQRMDILSARHRAHNAFDRIWRSEYCSRGEAYRMLAKFLEIPMEQAHFSVMNFQQCEAVERFFEKLTPKARKNASRRQSTDFRLRRRELEKFTVEEET